MPNILVNYFKLKWVIGDSKYTLHPDIRKTINDYTNCIQIIIPQFICFVIGIENKNVIVSQLNIDLLSELIKNLETIGDCINTNINSVNDFQDSIDNINYRYENFSLFGELPFRDILI